MSECLQEIHTSLQVSILEVCVGATHQVSLLFKEYHTTVTTDIYFCKHWGIPSNTCCIPHQALRSSLLSSSWGDTLLNSAHLVELALCLLQGRVPPCWLASVGPSAPPASWPLKEWVQDLVLRYAFLDRILAGGLAKTPTYWLGAFFDPQTFLSIMQQASKIRLFVRRISAQSPQESHTPLLSPHRTLSGPPPESLSQSTSPSMPSSPTETKTT